MRSSTRKLVLGLGLSAALSLGLGLAVAADQNPTEKPPAKTATQAKPATEAKKPCPNQAGTEAKGEQPGQKPMAPLAVPRIAPDQGC